MTVSKPQSEQEKQQCINIIGNESGEATSGTFDITYTLAYRDSRVMDCTIIDDYHDFFLPFLKIKESIEKIKQKNSVNWSEKKFRFTAL